MSNRNNGDRATELLRKLFIGGLNLNTDEEKLRRHFEQWGDLLGVVVMRNGGRNGKSRGFGFVTFKEAEMLDAAQANRPHIIDERTVQTKRAMPRDEANSAEAHITTEKLFVGALKKEVTVDDLRDYFGSFGTITDCEILTFRETGKSRGFGFVTFDDYDTVDKVLLHKPHFIDNKRCEVNKAISKEESRLIKEKEELAARYTPRQSNDEMMGLMGELRNRIDFRYSPRYQDYEDRYGRYGNQGYSGGAMRDYQSYRSESNYRSEPYYSNRMRRDY